MLWKRTDASKFFILCRVLFDGGFRYPGGKPGFFNSQLDDKFTQVSGDGETDGRLRILLNRKIASEWDEKSQKELEKISMEGIKYNNMIVDLLRQKLKGMALEEAIKVCSVIYHTAWLNLCS